MHWTMIVSRLGNIQLLGCEGVSLPGPIASQHLIPVPLPTDGRLFTHQQFGNLYQAIFRVFAGIISLRQAAWGSFISSSWR